MNTTAAAVQAANAAFSAGVSLGIFFGAAGLYVLARAWRWWQERHL